MGVLERGQLMLRPMPSPDITVIPITVTAITMEVTDMDTLSLDVATLMSIVALERGQLRLMPNPDITVIPMDFTVILTDTDTVLMDPVSLDTPLVPLTFTEAPKVSASKKAISDIP